MHEGWHTRQDWSLQLVPATSPLKSLHEGTGRRDLSHEQFMRSIFEKQVAGTCPKNSNQFEFVRLVAGTKIWSLRQDFVAKLASPPNGSCPRDLLQGLVARTSLPSSQCDTKMS